MDDEFFNGKNGQSDGSDENNGDSKEYGNSSAENMNGGNNDSGSADNGYNEGEYSYKGSDLNYTDNYSGKTYGSPDGSDNRYGSSYSQGASPDENSGTNGYEQYNRPYGASPYNGYGGENGNGNGGYVNNGSYDGGNNGNYGGSYFGSPYQNNNGAPVPPKKKNRGLKVFIIIIVVIVVLAIGLIIGIFTNNSDENKANENNGAVSQTQESGKVNTDNVGDIASSSSSLEAGEASEVAKIAKNFNVGILIYQNNTLYTEGSGVIIKEDDEHKYTYIVTCAHVVNHTGTAVSVLLEDGSEYPADIVGLDTRTDLAVIRIEASGFKGAEIANSDELIVGQTVYAVGNPGGSEFFGSVTNGIISAIDRPIRSSSNTGYEMECIQHTAAINPGNSGGALVNGEGKLIGINSMKIASTDYEGMGFAVPSSVVIKVFNSIIANGYVAGRAKLGITYASPSNYSQTYAMYVQMKGLPSGTIVIASISDDSELASKDVKVGDMITKVNGKEMSDTNMLADMIENMSVGDSLTLTIVRVNTDNWSQTENDITVKLVVDKGDNYANNSNSNNGNSGNNGNSSGGSANPFGGSGGDSYQDWYDFFREQYGF